MKKKSKRTHPSAQDQNHRPITKKVICSKEVQKIAEKEISVGFEVDDTEVTVHEDRISQNIVVVKGKIINIGVVPITATVSTPSGPLVFHEGFKFQEETACPGVCPGDTVTESPLRVEAVIAQPIQRSTPEITNFGVVIKVILRTTMTAVRLVIKSEDGSFTDVNQNRCQTPTPSTIQPPVLAAGPSSGPPGPGDIPTGVIVMWSGSISDIPQGWLLCNGNNGTPNLQDRFVLGTTNDGEIGDTGGNSSITLTQNQLAPHTHQGITNVGGSHDHGGFTGENGQHSHQYSVTSLDSKFFDEGDFIITYSADEGEMALTSTVGAHVHAIPTGGSHSHGFTTSSAGSGFPIDITNPYYQLAFIMKA